MRRFRRSHLLTSGEMIRWKMAEVMLVFSRDVAPMISQIEVWGSKTVSSTEANWQEKAKTMKARSVAFLADGRVGHPLAGPVITE